MATSTADTPFPTSSVSPATPAPNASSGSNAKPPAKVDSDKPAAGGESADVLSRVVQGAHSAIDRMAETAAPAVQRLQDGVQAAGDTLSQRASDARDMGDEWAESLRSTVREHPLAALATALAVGVLVARLAR
jgi:ElaB/YqjD/DUF883 family membrane-anchored ribosome-binding protein